MIPLTHGEAPAAPPVIPADTELFRNIEPVRRIPPQPLCCLAVDAEEDFDWDRPGYTIGYSTECMRRIVDLQEIVGAYGLRPAYLLTYPVLEDADVVRIIRRQVEQGQCEVGIQLHTWVTPPYETAEGRASHLGALSPALEERKLATLIAAFREKFGFPPILFRAGRYGLSPVTTGLLEQYGLMVDTSIAPHTDLSPQGGPDFSAYACAPFWFGRERRLLEVPLCRTVVGWSGSWAPELYRRTTGRHVLGLPVHALLGRLRIAERITLSPEGNDTGALGRLISGRRRQQQSVFTVSFHSSSLAPGRNPYVRDRKGLHVFYDRLSAMLDSMADGGFQFTTLSELPALLAATG